jgi:large subunit ribosomal protein L30
MRSAMDTAQKTIRIKWVRSGIGFNRSQSEVVRSLGLRRLNHVVERPDTPQVRGLVAKVAHLVEIVTDAPEPVWNSTLSYTIKAAPSQSAARAEEINVAASSPAAAIPTPVSEPDPVPEETASTSSPARAPTSSFQPATASEETVSSQNEQGEKE